MTIVQNILVASITPNPAQPRKTFDNAHISQLAESIAMRGLIQPITVREMNPDTFEIVAGECRWRAHKLLGVKTIACIVDTMTNREARYRAIVENIQRQDMNPIDEANAYQSLIEDGVTIQQIVNELGLNSQSIVKQRLSLLNLDKDLQGLVASKSIAVNMAWGIAQAPAQHQMRLVRDIGSGKLRTSEEVKHAGMALRDAAQQIDIFAELPKPSQNELAALSRLESKISQIALMVQTGFKDGECVAAKRVSPDRVDIMIEKLALIRKHVLQMEHALRCAKAQSEMFGDAA
jgi:ParB family chromosome partitioning protein